MKEYKRLGIVGRFKPLHLGAVSMLNSACTKADYVVIGVGSSNKYDLRNPFTAFEVEDMINCYLSPRFSNYEIVHVPDFGHVPRYKDGQKWKEYVVSEFGTLDSFVSGNDYVKELMSDDYTVIHPFSLVDEKDRVFCKGTKVRLKMATGGDWQSLVPKEVATYLSNHHLVERFRKEFGEGTLEYVKNKIDLNSFESIDAERSHVQERDE